MLVFSLFFILGEKLSIPKRSDKRTVDIFSIKLHEGYGRYFFYYSEVSGKKGSASYLKTLTERINRPLSWLNYSLLMKAAGNEQDALEGFTVFKKEARRTREIDNHDIVLLSRIMQDEISEGELSPVLVMTEELELGWFQHIVALLLYSSLEMKEKADTARERAIQEAHRTVKNVFFISSVLFFLFVAGIIFIYIGIKHEKIFQLFDRHCLYKLDAWCLFETFVLWLFIVTLLKVIVASSTGLVRMINSLDLTLRLCMLVGIYVLPCMSFLYLRKFTKQISISREELYVPHGGILKDIIYGIGGYCASIPVLFLSAIMIVPLVNRLEKVFPTPSNPAVEFILSSKTAVEWALVFILIACLAPVIEEIVFRGILQNAIKRRAGPWIAIVCSGCIFSLLHPQLPIGFLPILVLGITFGILAEARKSLIPSIVAHGINNGIIIAFVSVFT
jgi:membrane protease YdiL (CAAX protease family)